MELVNALLDSWDRQCQIVNSVAQLVTQETRSLLPSPDGWTLDAQLAHIGEVRYFWLSKFAPSYLEGLGEVFQPDGQTPLESLDTIRAELVKSGEAIRKAVGEALPAGQPSGGYDHPVLFLQHMIWHEGWHIGLIFLGLRLGGFEPAMEWEEEKVWGMWRTE